MKKFVIAIAALIMLGGAAVSVMKTMEIGPFAPIDGEIAEPAPPPPADPITVELDPLTIPIFHGDRIATTLQVVIHLETTEGDNEAKVRKYLTKVGDMFLRDLYAYLPRLIEKQGELDVEYIKQRLDKVVKKTPVGEEVTRVMIQSVSDSAVNQGN